MSEPRRHHYCPQSYLARFTEDGTKEGKLWVIDKTTHKVRPSKPNKAAHERDFYRVDVKDGADPFALEKNFSEIEGGASTAIQFIHDNDRLPDHESMGYLINFIGLLAVRTPWQRKHFGGFVEKVMKMVMSLTFAEKKRWEATKRRIQAEGIEIPNDVTYEEMVDFIQRDQYRLELDQNQQVLTMLRSASTIVDLLSHRNWAIVIAQGEAEFICSDNPVGLMWIKPIGSFHSPGFGMRNTEVTVPLSKKIGLVGTFEPLKIAFGGLDPLGVAGFNNTAIRRAT